MGQRSKQIYFLGYSDTSKGYRVWDLVREQLVITRSVTLDERPPIWYKHVVVSSESFAQCKHFHDESDEVNVGVTASNNHKDAEDMDVDATADMVRADKTWLWMRLEISISHKP